MSHSRINTAGLPEGQLVRTRRKTHTPNGRNVVYVDDGRILDVVGSTSVDRCPGCVIEGAQVGLLADGSLFHQIDDFCRAVFPPENEASNG